MVLKNNNLSEGDSMVLNEALFGKDKSRRLKAEKALNQVEDSIKFLLVQKDNLTPEFGDVLIDALTKYSAAELTKIVNQTKEGKVPLSFKNNVLPPVAEFDGVAESLIQARTADEITEALATIEQYMTIINKPETVKFPLKADTLQYNWTNWYLTTDKLVKLINTARNTKGEDGTTKIIATAILIDGYYKPYLIYNINTFISIIKEYRKSVMGKLKESDIYLNENKFTQNIFNENDVEEIAIAEIIDRLNMDIRFMSKEVKKMLNRDLLKEEQDKFMKEIDYPSMSKAIKERTSITRLNDPEKWEIIVRKFYKDILNKTPKCLIYYLLGDMYLTKINLYKAKVGTTLDDNIDINDLRGEVRAATDIQKQWVNEKLLPYLRNYGLDKIFKDSSYIEVDESNQFFIDSMMNM